MYYLLARRYWSVSSGRLYINLVVVVMSTQCIVEIKIIYPIFTGNDLFNRLIYYLPLYPARHLPWYIGIYLCVYIYICTHLPE